jgi:hypothetical protein
MADVNGVDVTDFRLANIEGFNATMFSAFNPTSTSFVYNEAGGVASDSGELDVSNIIEAKTLQVSIPTLGSGSITVIAEGRTKNAPDWGLVWQKTYSAATTIAQLISLLEYVDRLRIGVKVVSNGIDVINITGGFITERKR